MKLAMSIRLGHIVLLIDRNITSMVNAPVILTTPLTLTIGLAISYGGASPLKEHPSKNRSRASCTSTPPHLCRLKLFEIYVCKMYLSVIMSSLCINNAANSRVAMPPQQYLLIRHHGILGCSIAATAKVTPSRRRMSDCHTCLNICVYVNAKAW